MRASVFSVVVVFAAALAAVVVLTACDDVPLGPGADANAPPTGEIPLSPTACDIAAHVTEVHCTGCHGGGTEPLLTLDGLKATVGAASVRYGGTLVTAGDPDGSLLYRKIHGPLADEGAQMPIGAPLSAELQDAVRRWIADGAAVDCEALQPGEPVQPDIQPGGPVVVSSPPSGFARSAPSFAAGEKCSTGQWWQHPGDDEESFLMHPGRACIDCHTRDGDEDAPRFLFAGTVMGAVDDEDDCRGVAGVTVDVLDVDDVVVASAVTNAAGNFGLCASRNGGTDEDIGCGLAPPTSPFRVRLSWEGRTREMFSHQDGVGDCMACHTQSGRNGAPGRVVAP